MNVPCRHCGQSGDSAFPFCEHCGAPLANSSEFECEAHTDRSAVGMCVVCYKPVCETCKTINGKKFVCSDPLHQQILNDWKIVHYSESEFEADAIQRNLNAANIESKMFSLHDHLAVHFVLASRVAVWVKRQDFPTANTVLTDLDLITKVHRS